MQTTPYLQSQTALKANILNLLRDSGNALWSDAEVYRAMNMAIEAWGDMVRLPQQYTITGGYSATVYEYSLPSYIRPPIQPQIKVTQPVYYPYVVDGTETYTWLDIQAFDTEPDGDGGLTLRLRNPPYALEGRVIWWAPNSPVPTDGADLPALSSELSAGAVSLTVDQALPEIRDAGWVLCEAEWMSYAGLTRAASTTTPTNLERGLNGSTDTTHASETDVEWAIAVDDMRLFNELRYRTMSNLHALMLVHPGQGERSAHEKMMIHYGNMADQILSTYRPARKAKTILARSHMAL